MPNLYIMHYRNLTVASCVIFTTGIASIHMVNVLITMNKNLKPPGALGKMPMMSIPHIAKGQERSIGQRGFAYFIVCFWNKLIVLAFGDNFHRIILSCRPVEIVPEDFAYDRAP
jgi:hypothetical protein